MTHPAHEIADWGPMPQRPGLYLSMSHGCDFPAQIMRGRGFAGPKIGPVLYVKTCCGQEVTLRFATLRDAKRFFPETVDKMPKLQIVEGTLVHDGKCYGDWDVCFIAEAFCLPRKSAATQAN